MPGIARKPLRRKGLAATKKPARDRRLLASTTLSDAKVREVIRCYAYARTPTQAIERTGLSHVTVYRLYGLIRKRLAFFSLIVTKGKFIDYINEGEEEGAPYFDWDGFEAFLSRELGKRRGIKSKNKPLYVSEAILKFEGHYTPQQLYGLIIMSIRLGGPLNREPTIIAHWSLALETMRINLLRMRTKIRQRDTQGMFDWMLPALDGLEDRAGRRI